MTHVDTESISEALVGRKIIDASGGRLTLDNGSTITFEEMADCCAYGEVERLVALDNVITSVRIEETTNDRHNPNSQYIYSIYALAEGSVDTEVVHIVGNEGSGYYAFGVHIKLNGVEIGGPYW